jgi:hypothetical protein
MHEHSASALAATPLLYAVTMGLVLSATLFGLRHLVSDWHRLNDHVTPATHVAMGAAMTYAMAVPQVVPDLVGAAALVAVGLAFCHRAHAWWTAAGSAYARVPVTPGMTMTMVMAVMFMGAERGSPLLRLALLGCLLGCAVVYARPALSGRVGGAGSGAVSTPLVLTAGMAAMLALP